MELGAESRRRSGRDSYRVDKSDAEVGGIPGGLAADTDRALPADGADLNANPLEKGRGSDAASS